MKDFEFQLGRQHIELRPVKPRRYSHYVGVQLRFARSIPVPEGLSEGDTTVTTPLLEVGVEGAIDWTQYIKGVNERLNESLPAPLSVPPKMVEALEGLR